MIAPWKSDLQAALEKDQTADTVLRWLGIPTIRDFPTPGDARLWAAREWATWCKTRGYDEGRQTNQSVIFTHRANPKFTVAATRTVGDPRSGMNCAADSRRAVILYSRELDVRLRHALDSLPDDEAAARAEIATWDLASPRPESLRAAPQTVEAETAYRLIQELARDQKCSMVKVVEEAIGHDDDRPDFAQQVVDKAKVGVPIPKTFYDLLLEYRRSLAAEELIEREEKRAKREERAFKPVAKSPRDVVSDLVGQIQKTRRQELDSVIGALNSAMDRARLARESIDTNPPTIPELNDPELAAKLTQREAELTQACLERDANGLEVTRLKELLVTEQSKDQKSHRVTFAKLILELVTTTDFSNLAANLKALKEAAQDEIKDAGG
jgi:hypothetical protein